MTAIRKSILNIVAVLLLMMIPSQALALDLVAKIKTNTELATADVKASVREAAKKEADRCLREMKAEALAALNERLGYLAKQPGHAVRSDSDGVTADM